MASGPYGHDIASVLTQYRCWLYKFTYCPLVKVVI